MTNEQSITHGANRLATLGAIAVLLISMLATTPGANAEPAAPHVAIPYDMATDQFGISNREDAPTIDVYTEALDSSGQRWVPVFKDEVARDAIEEEAESPSMPQAQRANKDSIQVTLSRYERKEIDSSLSSLETLVLDIRAYSTLRYDPIEDRIEIAVDGDFHPRFNKWDGAVELELIDMNIQPNELNTGYKKPHYGGMAVWTMPMEGIGDQRGYCTLGIPARNANGTKGIFSAGHCLRLGESVHSYSNRSDSFKIGTVTHAYGRPQIDAAFISGGDYRPYIMTGNGRSTSKPIVGGYYPSVGKRLCYNGITTGRNCGNSLLQQGVTQCDGFIAGFCSKVNVLGGSSSSQPGDSGAPVYANFGGDVRVNGMIWGSGETSGGASRTFVTSFADVKRSYGANIWFA